MDASVTALETGAARTPPRRRPHDWVVDTLVFLLAVLFGLLAIGGRLEVSPPVEQDWLFWADVAAGAVGCLGLWVRRRWPVGLALVLIALSTFSEFVAGAMVLAMLTVAIHRPPRTTAWVFGLSVLAALVYVVVRPEPGVDAVVLFLIGVIVQAAAVGWGLFIHYRRQLVLSLRDRAERAETEAQLRAEQAQQRARDQIAREMHDVLGHRLSLLSVHAGALEFRPDAPAEEVARAAKVIRENAHQALQDLREVIGVLRAPTEASQAEVEAVQAGTAPPGWASAPVGELPQPTVADVQQLVAESGRAGMRVSVRDDTAGAVPDLTGRTAYRVVQEALTNARKHAPGVEVHVHLAGSPGAGLTVEVRNEPSRPGPHPDPPLPGPPVGERSPTVSSGPAVVHSPGPAAGQGLVGLAERVTLASGRLEYGPAAGGGWCLRVWLPWPP
jgi:signal transduction histidine kinase